jgi:hypothetical protein
MVLDDTPYTSLVFEDRFDSNIDPDVPSFLVANTSRMIKHVVHIDYTDQKNLHLRNEMLEKSSDVFAYTQSVFRK